MDTIDDGGAAFPCYEYGSLGISMRDYFAAKAMDAMLSTLAQGIRPADVPLMAADAYGIADAMLKARHAPR